MKKFTLTLVSIIILQCTYSQLIMLDVEVFLEGPVSGTEMNTKINAEGLIPFVQPFNQPPWNYAGNESISDILDPGIVDWVLIELRETTGNSSTAIPETIIARQACLIDKDGQIRNIDGIDLLQFELSISDNLYVLIWHRNHLCVMSAAPITESGEIYDYDFTDNLSKAYMNGQKEIASGIFVMIAGDCDGSGIIDEQDKNDKWSIGAGDMGYESADINLDCEINNTDKDDYWYWNIGSESKVPLEIPFNCGEQISDVDGNIYNTVQIGTQCWMKENLQTTTFSNGTPIANVTANSAWANLATSAYVYYENNTGWKDLYGALYNWYATVDANGLCPSGWSVPANDDWNVLTNFIGGSGSTYGNKLKSCRQVDSPWPGECNTAEHPRWNSYSAHWGTDDYGFSGTPGGLRLNNGTFTNLGKSVYWWAITTSSSGLAWTRNLGYYYGSFDVVDYYKQGGFSVRCLRD